jgi:iron complex transport system ATP-binding protein
MSTLLKLENLSCGYTRRAVLSGVNLTLHGGEFFCLLGPNGSGKSALLKTLAGVLKPLGGRIHSGVKGHSWLAYVPQAHAPLFSFRILDMVVMGRTSRWPLWSGPGEADWDAARTALAQVGMEAFAERLYTEVSGGERQMVLIARALAQEARFLILDEPASSLDFGNQLRMLQTLRRLAASGIGILMATHHPEHALRCATRAAVVKEGRLLPPGAPGEVISPEMLESLYHVPFSISEVPDKHQKPVRVCIPQLD